MHLFHAFSTFKPGGAEMRTVALMNEWGGRYRHSILAMDGNYEAADLIRAGVQFELVKLPVNKGRWLPNLLSFRRALKKIEPDVMLSYNFGAFEWAFSNVPRICRHIHVEDGFLADEIERRNPRRSAIRALAFRLLPIHLVTVSNNLTTIAKNEWKCPSKQIAFLPNGIQLEKFERSVGALQNATFTLGTVAGLRPEKRIDRIIEAFALAVGSAPNRSSWILKIAGSGDELNSLQKLVMALGLSKQVSFVGHLSDPSGFYAGLDVFLLGSDTEQMPLVVLEAMAAGLPVASTNVGDVSVMLGKTNGSEIHGSTATELAEQINKLASSSELRSGFGSENYEKVKLNFGFSSMVERWQALIESKQF
jgi:glycosyltransferase involved in cell wall biosynthesis